MSRFKHTLPNLVVPTLVLLFVLGGFAKSSVLIAAPLLSEPKFSYISTENGLSQDTITSLLLDQEGFLWLGTEAGLNRYDGYRVKSIGFDNVQLDEMAITALMQDSRGDMWVGTATTGVYLIDMANNQAKQIGQWNFKFQADWPQQANGIVETEQGHILLALDQQVVQINPKDNSQTTLYYLNDTLAKDEHIIRFISYHQGVLLVATSAGLYGVDLDTGESKEINFLAGFDKNENSYNVKFLSVDPSRRLFIGTVEGLFSIPFASVSQFLTGKQPLSPATLRIPELNIWTMVPLGDNRYSIGTNQGLYNYSVEGDQLEHLLKPTDSRLLLTDDDIKSIVIDKSNNLWMGTGYDGALYWSPKSAQFTNVISTVDGEREFSDYSVWSMHQQTSDQLWVGTENGLNLYGLNDGEIESFLVSADSKALYSSSSIDQIIPAKNDQLWLVTADGLSLFDTQSKKLTPTPSANLKSKTILNKYMWGVSKDGFGNLWFVNEDGVYKYNVDSADVVQVESILGQVNHATLNGLFVNHDAFPNSILLTETGKLWSLNLTTNQLQLVHSLPEVGQQQFSAPDSVVMDDNGVLWIAYPGHGLFGVDKLTGETLHQFNRTNLLPSNSIYGLQRDSDGNIWMSSHRGLLKFYPDNQHLQRFGYAEGVAPSEFNQWAYTTLDDNRMVYGSQKGITIFNPTALGYSDKVDFEVAISEIEVASSDIRFPLSNLSGHRLELEHDDVGLTFSFSTLAYHHQKSTRYRYAIAGDSVVSFPVSRDPQINLSRLDPGSYEISVSAFDPVTGVESQPAIVFVKVNYAVWASPLAYTLYALVIISVLGYWWYRRDLHNSRILAAHEEVLNSKNRLSMALTGSNSSVWEWREQTNTILAPTLLSELGYPEENQEVSMAQHLAYIHPQDRKLFESNWQAFLDDPAVGWDITYRLKAKDKSWMWFRFVGRVAEDKHHADKNLLVGTLTNITESLANIEKVRLFGEAFKHTRDWVIIFDEFFTPVAANQAFGEAFGIDEQNNLAAQFEHLFEPDSDDAPRFLSKLLELSQIEHWKGEEHLSLKNGKTYDVLVNMTSVVSARNREDVDYFLMIMSDISEQKEAENELRHMANFDSLTKLPNRTLLLDRVKHAIDHAARNHSTIGLFFIDLDKFKQVNDSLGHKAGDELLKVVAQRLTNLLRQDDTVARLGGDEFVVMVEDVKQPDKLSVLAREVISVIEEAIQLGNQTVSVSSSVGIALYPTDAVTSEELLKNADVAMYHAKEQGRSNFQYFTEHMNELAQARLVLENKLKHAHQQKEFENYYQPIVSLSSGKVEGFELLMRWPTDDGMIPPDKFIPVAEELGLIEDMTWDALERAMPLLSEWQQGGNDIYLSVNLSARHFERQISIDQILLLLQQHQLSVPALRFEITESALMKDYERALEYMKSMQEQGFIIALDDFGTGYSSLKYLKEFPIQILKVDKSFVDDIGKNKSNEALILTTLRMAESLNMYCVAEGIEEQSQIDFFKLHGCDYLQGYFFSKPVPDSQTNALIEQSWLA